MVRKDSNMTNDSIHDIVQNRPISFPPIYGENIEWMYRGVRISIERITPDDATKMLEANIGNRKPKREPLVQAILNGEWILNGATIVFDTNGNLIDGQNRLIACVKSGRPIETIVVRGIERAAQITMDSGVKRKLDDYLTLDGYKNASAVGAIGSALLRVDTYGITAAFHKPSGSDFTIKARREFIRSNYEVRIEPLVKPCRSVQNTYSGIENATTGALFDMFKKAGENNFEEFTNQLTKKRTACTALRLLIKKLDDNVKAKDGKLPQRVIAALMIKAWNAYMRGDEISLLRFTQGGATPEKFPEVFLGYE